MDSSRALVLRMFVCFSVIVAAETSVLLKFHLFSYENSNLGGCKDGQGCVFLFSLCITKKNSGLCTRDDDLGFLQIVGVQNSPLLLNHHTKLDQSADTMIKADIPVWQDEADVVMSVRILPAGDDTVFMYQEDFHDTLQIILAYPGQDTLWINKTVENQDDGLTSSISYAYSTQCADRYFGRRCTTYCVGGDSPAGHYFCDVVTGEKVCLPGWEGIDKLCTESLDDCDGNVCVNNATCVDGYIDYRCNCQPGFQGEHCELEVDVESYASPDPDYAWCSVTGCQNGGECYDERCVCPDGYQGSLCQLVNPTDETDITGIVACTISSVTLVVLVIFGVTTVLHNKRKNALKDKVVGSLPCYDSMREDEERLRLAEK